MRVGGGVAMTYDERPHISDGDTVLVAGQTASVAELVLRDRRVKVRTRTPLFQIGTAEYGRRRPS